MAKSMKLKAAKRPPKIAVKPYRVQIGTPNQPGPTCELARVGETKTKARSAFSAWLEFCKRSNQAGTPILENAMEQVDKFMGTETADSPLVILAPFDAYTGLTVRVAMWRT